MKIADFIKINKQKEKGVTGMRRVSRNEQKTIKGGGHYHWKCSVTPFITPTKFGTANDAWYYAGVHAEKYGHHGKMSVFYCNCI